VAAPPLSVPRSARYFTTGADTRTAREIWFVLHGYGQLAGRFLRYFTGLGDDQRTVIAPEALSRFYLEADAREKVGASWMTREDRLTEIDDYVHYLDVVFSEVTRERRPPGGIHVLGFSQGTATACRWLVYGRARADRLILWGGEVPPDLDLVRARERWEHTAVMFVAGSGDRFITPKVLARDEQRLQDYGIGYQVERFEGGHEIRGEVLARVAGSTE
jgi:predicted esterase